MIFPPNPNLKALSGKLSRKTRRRVQSWAQTLLRNNGFSDQLDSKNAVRPLNAALQTAEAMVGALWLPVALGSLTALIILLHRFKERLEVQREQLLSVDYLVNTVNGNKQPLPSIFGPASRTLSVVIPAYNEESRISPTLDEILFYLKRRRNKLGPHFTFEIVVVDDGSTDQTAHIAGQYSSQEGFDTLRVLRMKRNYGKGCAVKHGMLITRGEQCLMVDADGATQIADFEHLDESLKQLRNNKPGLSGTVSSTSAIGFADREELVGMVYGSRARMAWSGAAAERSWLRKQLTKGFHLGVMMVAGSQVKDTQCGFKLFTRRTARLLFPQQRLQGWTFDVELLMLANHLKVPTTEVPVHWQEMPGSKVGLLTPAAMALELLLLQWGYKWPLGGWKVHAEKERAH